MDGATERRIVYVLCLVVAVLGLLTLSRSLSRVDLKSIGVSLGLIAISIVTAVAASRSGQLDRPIENGAASEGGPD